ncbi:MAG: TetR/AcrR family transcriptional regulator [Candidatus Abyssobacteria bacterium SURF_17]|uniref:TetR/AcrR family transcriptional regulator n=1 Tax=Candidatus Abyssobacteria bacterium SURF_17 TaxID=2093361 RepID=A0A419F9G7_9BACT|nr:MAG: TetR/AcrR family transcriptional regulator [Candidatus Abyssubacteria bacterium SURF_17]
MARRLRIEQERQARMTRILEATEQLFIEKGYHDTSINDIAEAADFSRTSIYQYFSSKEEIYIHILEQYTDLLAERVAKASAAAVTVPEKIRIFLGEMRQVMKEKPNFFKLYFIQRHQVEPRLSPELRTQLNAKRRMLENVFRDFYRRGVEAGEVRAIRPKDASNLFFAQITGMMLLHEYYGEEFDVTLDEHLNQSLQMYLEFVEDGKRQAPWS